MIVDYPDDGIKSVKRATGDNTHLDGVHLNLLDELDSTLMLKGDYNGKPDLVKPKPRAGAQILKTNLMNTHILRNFDESWGVGNIA